MRRIRVLIYESEDLGSFERAFGRTGVPWNGTYEVNDRTRIRSFTVEDFSMIGALKFPEKSHAQPR